jgi:RNA polymerase sigma-70 factor (ECF subfamily)
MSTSHAQIEDWFATHRTFLWGLCYRITGCAADADDVVQETFIRAIERAPSHLDEPRRWLVKVAVNVSRDLLRRRRRRSYAGPWLPGPIRTAEPGETPVASYEPTIGGTQTLEGRYDLMESVSIAFLEALEALTPTQRAVLLLCDVFDYSAAETAAALDMSAGNVRIVHHRARRAMEAYERNRPVRTPESQQGTADMLRKFLDLLGKADVGGIERMLAADVRAVTDGGGEFTATRRPIVGRGAVARLFVRLASSRSGGMRTQMIHVNGSPAVLFEFDTPSGRRPPRFVLAADLNASGLMTSVWVIANTRKLIAVPPAAPPELAAPLL